MRVEKHLTEYAIDVVTAQRELQAAILRTHEDARHNFSFALSSEIDYAKAALEQAWQRINRLTQIANSVPQEKVTT